MGRILKIILDLCIEVIHQTCSNAVIGNKWVYCRVIAWLNIADGVCATVFDARQLCVELSCAGQGDAFSKIYVQLWTGAGVGQGG